MQVDYLGSIGQESIGNLINSIQRQKNKVSLLQSAGAFDFVLLMKIITLHDSFRGFGVLNRFLIGKMIWRLSIVVIGVLYLLVMWGGVVAPATSLHLWHCNTEEFVGECMHFSIVHHL